jgi:hypothetical protein
MSDRLPAFVKVMESAAVVDVTGPEYLVLLVVASYARPDGKGCYASHATLARRAHMSERRLREYLKRLREKGVLEVFSKGGPGGVNEYAIPCSDPEHGEPGDPEHGRPGSRRSTRPVSVADPVDFGISPGTPPSDKQKTGKNKGVRGRPSAAHAGGAASAAPKKAGRAEPYGDGTCKRCPAPVTAETANKQHGLCDACDAKLEAGLTGTTV